MKDVRFFPDFKSLHRFLRGKSNEITPKEVKKEEKPVESKEKPKKKPAKKAKGE